MCEPTAALGDRGLDRITALQRSGEQVGGPAFDAFFEALTAASEQQRREAAAACGIALSECEWIGALARGVLRARRDPAYPAARAVPVSMRGPTLAELAGTYGSKNVDLVLAHEAVLAELLLPTQPK